MPKHSLTDLSIRKLATDDKGRYDIWDTRVHGLGVRVFKSGVKSFFLSYRINGKRRRETLGRYSEISLAEARQLAYERRAQIARGEDPTKKAKSKETTFESVVDDFVILHVGRHTRPSTARMYKSILWNEYLPLWRNKKISEIDRQDIVAILDKIVARGNGAAANYAYAVISKFFNWCISRDFIDVNPCTGIERPAKLKVRHRVLSDNELFKVWSAALQAGNPFGTIVALLILTGQRRGEVTNMEWDQIDWDEKVWNLPAALTKNKNPHSLPLPDPVLEVLLKTPQINNEKFVFPAQGSSITTFSGFSKSKRRLDREIQIDEWRLHDLRRTAATGMARAGTAPHVVERILNHTSGTFGGVAGVYNRFGYLPEMREALELWSAHVMALQTVK